MPPILVRRWAIETVCVGLLALAYGLRVLGRWLGQGIPPT